MMERVVDEDMDVVVAVYGDEAAAHAGFEAVKAARDRGEIGLHDAALVVHDRPGKRVRVRETIGMTALPGAAIGLTVGAVLGMFTGPVGFVVVTAAGALVGGFTGYEIEHPKRSEVKASGGEARGGRGCGLRRRSVAGRRGRCGRAAFGRGRRRPRGLAGCRHPCGGRARSRTRSRAVGMPFPRGRGPNLPAAIDGYDVQGGDPRRRERRARTGARRWAVPVYDTSRYW